MESLNIFSDLAVNKITADNNYFGLRAYVYK